MKINVKIKTIVPRHPCQIWVQNQCLNIIFVSYHKESLNQWRSSCYLQYILLIKGVKLYEEEKYWKLDCLHDHMDFARNKF